MEAAQTIREAVASVTRLRQAADMTPGLREAVTQVKRIQSQRFAGTYADLLQAQGPSAQAARFFLEELYSDKDYAQRDAQFARIATAIEKLFPAQVVATAVALARLHALTEDLDQAMGIAWMAASPDLEPALRYAAAWRSVGRDADRREQLAVVADIGAQMARLTRTPGLRLMLKMMRGPASAAGMGALQHFLESGFDTFAAMARKPGAVDAFLGTIRERETALLQLLAQGDLVACGTHLSGILGQAR